jgi:hypothetical protein
MSYPHSAQFCPCAGSEAKTSGGACAMKSKVIVPKSDPLRIFISVLFSHKTLIIYRKELWALRLSWKYTIYCRKNDLPEIRLEPSTHTLSSFVLLPLEGADRDSLHTITPNTHSL